MSGNNNNDVDVVRVELIALACKSQIFIGLSEGGCAHTTHIHTDACLSLCTYLTHVRVYVSVSVSVYGLPGSHGAHPAYAAYAN